jgi:hypothetical protein
MNMHIRRRTPGEVRAYFAGAKAGAAFANAHGVIPGDEEIEDILAMAEPEPVPEGDYAIQQVTEEGEAPFLLYKGVLVGRLYGGCPYSEMLELLNPSKPVDPRA